MTSTQNPSVRCIRSGVRRKRVGYVKTSRRLNRNAAACALKRQGVSDETPRRFDGCALAFEEAEEEVKSAEKRKEWSRSASVHFKDNKIKNESIRGKEYK